MTRSHKQRVELRRFRAERGRRRRRSRRLPAPGVGPSASGWRRSRACSRGWRARPGPGREPGNSWSATRTGPRRSRRRRTGPAAKGRAFPPARRLRTSRSSWRRGSCCCRSSPPAPRRRRRNARCACPSPRGSASPLANASSDPPHMKVSVPAVAPADAARNRRVERQHARRARLPRARASRSRRRWSSSR